MINEKAIKEFGLINDFKEAGYILTNGKLLDFSGKRDGGCSGVRYMDHREIESILESNYTDALIEFMNMGNIRLNPESQGLDISVLPTKEQEITLRNYFNYFKGEIIVDISDINGKNIANFECREKTASSKIISDIKEMLK